ncbi:hypothetical protein [Methylobacterium sp. 77]|uniref:hypothetical protein n=1 Tax=Methylobacterium sp. 77 TaxID=1101192 RepID=UPI0003AB055C|nr:hypothetical protein [Methylobacterium sp. 77]
MGVYFEQKLSISGSKSTLLHFVARCIDIGSDDVPIGIAFERIAPTPVCLPEGNTIGRLGCDVDVGVEALTGRARSSPDRAELGLTSASILESEDARSLGLTTHGGLKAWLWENDPGALEIGRAALAAYELTAHWSRQEWQTANWGGSAEDMECLVLSFGLVYENATEITIRLTTKSVTVHPLIGHLSRNFPSLNFRLVLADDGYDFPLISTATHGDVVDRQVEVTDEFVAEIEGAPREVSDFYLTPSAAKPEPMTHVRFWLSKRRFRSSIADYPVYSPPFRGFPPTLTDEQAEANFRHFLDTKGDRSQNLRTFLRSFRVDINETALGIPNLDRWLWQYGAFLKVSETGAAHLTHEPEWKGHWRSENVQFDLATLLGQSIVDRYDGYRWEQYTDVPPGLRINDDHYRSFTIWNGDPASRIWIFQDLRVICTCLYEMSFMWSRRHSIHLPGQDLRRIASTILSRPAKQGLQHSQPSED